MAGLEQVAGPEQVAGLEQVADSAEVLVDSVAAWVQVSFGEVLRAAVFQVAGRLAPVLPGLVTVQVVTVQVLTVPLVQFASWLFVRLRLPVHRAAHGLRLTHPLAYRRFQPSLE